MQPERVSRTAIGTAYLRAAHQVLDAPPHVLEDPIAVPLLGAAALQRINDNADRYRTAARCQLRAHVVLRSRFAEDRLAAAVLRGVTQYVILGAGLDTFALRQPAPAQPLRIVEVDHPDTQALKRRYLADAGLRPPKNVELIALDLARESLRGGLARNRISSSACTFFSCLGVTMYLPEHVIDEVLRSAAAFPAGSEIVLTFARPPIESPSPIAQHAAALGEPWVSYFEPDAIAAKLRGAGFADVAFLSPEEAYTRYFRARPNDLPVPHPINIAYARR